MPDDNIDVLAAVRDLAPSISARSAEIESGRRLPLDLLAQLIAAGCFRMLTPRSHGGLEVDLPLSMDFLSISSYGEDSEGVVRITKDLEENIAGKDVLLIEDIVDTGISVVPMLKL